MPVTRLIPVLLFLILLAVKPTEGYASAPSDTSGPKHYLRPVVYLNTMSQRRREFKNNPNEYFGFRQSNLGCMFPIYTHTAKDANGNPGNVFQVVGNANLMIARPQFSMIAGDHSLSRTSFATNFIYNAGQKNVFFVNVNPFIAEDRSALRANPALRYTWMVIYNRTVNEYFSFRLGWARTYVLGGLPRAPILGFRIGRYDRVHFNFQFPRYFSLDVPFSGRYNLSVFHRFMGGIYGLRDVDFKGAEYKNVILRRTDQISGLEFTMQASSSFSFFVNAGVVSQSKLGLIDVKTKRLSGTNNYLLQSDYGALTNVSLKRAGMLNFGLQYSFGSAKKIYKHSSMMDAVDMNKTFGNGDSNEPGAQLPQPYVPSKPKLQSVQMKDIQDLVTEGDLY